MRGTYYIKTYRDIQNFVKLNYVLYAVHWAILEGFSQRRC
jgi:hypothetical protein